MSKKNSLETFKNDDLGLLSVKPSNTKPASEKVAKRVPINLTQREYEILQKKAGAVQKSTYLKLILTDAGAFSEE